MYLNITNRLYTAPVLSIEKTDYRNTVFNVNTQYEMAGINTILLKFDVEMTNVEMLELIKSKRAEYMIHIECSNTCYRTSIHFTGNSHSIEIPVDLVNGKVEMVAFIIAKEEIKNFINSDWDDDYIGLSFNYERASILGYQNLQSLDITKDFDEFAKSNSIFLIYKMLTEDSIPMEVDFDMKKIKIGLCEKEYVIYKRLCDKPEYQQILNSMIIFPTLVYLFEQLKLEGGIDENSGKAWFKALENSYRKRGMEFSEEVLKEDKTSLLLAQEAMEMPICSALTGLVDLADALGGED